MIRKMIILGILCFFCLNLTAANNVNLAPGGKEGYVLLDKLVGTFMELAEKGTPAEDKMNKALHDMWTGANKAKSQGQIDSVFFMRYTRILRLFRLLSPGNPEGLLYPLMEREIIDFIENVKGEKVSDITGAKGIEIFADAIAEEILNLQLYLDNKKDRDKLRKEFKRKLEKAEFYKKVKSKK